MLEKMIIEYCAPTLAALKTGNLFACSGITANELHKELEQLNRKLNSRGVFLELLSDHEDRFLIYVYRPDRLTKDLSIPLVRKIMKSYGYIFSSIDASLDHLRSRLAKCPCFPHEIGFFLGYPIGDVVGFIRHSGKNCKLCGLWKVYCNEASAQKTFDALRKCSTVYTKVYEQGRSIEQMTVAS